MTPAEAEKMFCVQTLNDDKKHWCLGSLCMAWRWLEQYKVTKDGPDHEIYTPQGFCGLAGKPEVLV